MRALIPDSITVRTSLLFCLLATGVFLTMGLLICASVGLHFKEQDRVTLEGKLELISSMFDGRNSRSSDNPIRQQLAAAMVGHHHLVVRIVDENGRDIFVAGHAPIPDRIVRQARSRATHPLHDWELGGMAFRGIAATVRPVNAGPIVVAIATDTRDHQEFIANFRQRLLMVGGIGLLLVMGLGWLAVQRGLRPVTKMAEVAQGISAHRLQERLEVDVVPRELRPLARSFNAMLDRLADSLTRLSDFSSDLAHELRTPINTLMTQT
ncbi:MAG: HAMP domain-containing protein [Pseudomonadota bacterium]